MEQHGIGACILSMPGAANLLTRGDSRSLARALNEELAELVQRLPRQVGAFAVLPLHDMDEALEEMTYALDTLGLDGVSAPAHYHGHYLGTPGYEPWFEEMQRRRTPLFVHPDDPPNFKQADSAINVSLLEFMFDTTRMLTHMVLSGTKQRYNKIPIISTHGGGTLPYLANRIAVAASYPFMYVGGTPQSADEVWAALATFYFDLTASTAPTMLNALRDVVPAEQLLMGFDFPLMPAETIAPAVAAFNAYPGFNDRQRRAIRCGNAQRLFKRFATSAA